MRTRQPCKSHKLTSSSDCFYCCHVCSFADSISPEQSTSALHDYQWYTDDLVHAAFVKQISLCDHQYRFLAICPLWMSVAVPYVILSRYQHWLSHARLGCICFLAKRCQSADATSISGRFQLVSLKFNTMLTGYLYNGRGAVFAYRNW